LVVEAIGQAALEGRMVWEKKGEKKSSKKGSKK
jgi:hypothetical protein